MVPTALELVGTAEQVRDERRDVSRPAQICLRKWGIRQIVAIYMPP